MNILAFFTDGGIPKLGLAPTIRIRNVATKVLIVSDATMTEIGDGFYAYNFVGFDPTIDYSIRCDGGGGLPSFERYKFAGNEVDKSPVIWAHSTRTLTAGTKDAEIDTIKSNTERLLSIESGRWHIIGDQMIFYKEDNVTEIMRFNLFDRLGQPATKEVVERRRV